MHTAATRVLSEVSAPSKNKGLLWLFAGALELNQGPVCGCSRVCSLVSLSAQSWLCSRPFGEAANPSGINGLF